ncbi:MAG: hypothetical protein M3542_04455 [Acidobacteriota bacterium]|nr:hypothetical protein [Acidobacteriota bacterium]MDQ5873544.1 hypothetical protein [Acidobacteriota bacterium]
MSEIGLVEVSGEAHPSVAEAEPLYSTGRTTVTLQFLVSVNGGSGLEALRYARRSLLREERTRGRDGEEPSLEDAVFSPTQIVWIVGPGQRPAALAQLEVLLRRANLLLSELERSPEAAGASGGSSTL